MAKHYLREYGDLNFLYGPRIELKRAGGRKKDGLAAAFDDLISARAMNTHVFDAPASLMGRHANI